MDIGDREKIKKRLLKNSQWNRACLETKYKIKENGAIPQIRIKNKDISVHRAAWLAEYGAIPQGMFVCHKCNNTKCFLIDHLYLGNPSTKRNSKKGRKAMDAKNIERSELMEGIERLQELEDAYKRATLVCYGSPDQYQFRHNELIRAMAEIMLQPLYDIRFEEMNKKMKDAGM